MPDKAFELIKQGMEKGDSAAVVQMVRYAVHEAIDNRFCECKYPALYGPDLICGACFKVNRGQVKYLEWYRAGWHTAMPDKTFPKLCQACARNVEHPCHTRDIRIL